MNRFGRIRKITGQRIYKLSFVEKRRRVYKSSSGSGVLVAALAVRGGMSVESLTGIQ